MEEKEKEAEVSGDLEQRKKKETGDGLSYCTTAPSAEHHRAHEEDEPCDDGTSGTAE